MNRRQSPTIFVLLLFSYFVAISIVSHIPGKELAKLDVGLWDKAAHVVEYIPVGILFSQLLLAWTIGLVVGWRILFGILFFAVLATIDECHQYLVPGRYASVWDGIADVFGGLLGMAITGLVMGIKKKIKQETKT